MILEELNTLDGRACFRLTRQTEKEGETLWHMISPTKPLLVYFAKDGISPADVANIKALDLIHGGSFAEKPPATRWYKPSERLPEKNGLHCAFVVRGDLRARTGWWGVHRQVWFPHYDLIGGPQEPEGVAVWTPLEPPIEDIAPVVDAKCCLKCEHGKPELNTEDMRCRKRGLALVKDWCYCDLWEKRDS
jgi:hypothetical protein